MRNTTKVFNSYTKQVETMSINQTTLHSKAYQALIANKQAITFKQRLALVLGAKQNQRPVKEWK